jgi:sugar phosphate isomerase/epimerase
MDARMNRRRFLKRSGATCAGLGMLGYVRPMFGADGKPGRGAPNAEKLGWHLSCSSYCFQLFTLFEAMEKTASLGLKYIDIYPGQRLGKDFGDVVVSGPPTTQQKTAIKKRLADHGLTVGNYATMDYPKDDDAWRKLFDCLQEMGIDTFVTEPAEGMLEGVDKLCNEYRINLAIHNHPKPSHYWNPDNVLKVVKGRSDRMGSCADTGHWKRSGLDPVQCMKKLEGRIKCFHFKDLIREGSGYHDVPWGMGECNVRGMLEEAHRQKLKVEFCFEYEYHWENSLPEIAQSIMFFEEVASQIAARK